MKNMDLEELIKTLVVGGVQIAFWVWLLSYLF